MSDFLKINSDYYLGFDTNTFELVIYTYLQLTDQKKDQQYDLYTDQQSDSLQ